MAPKDLEPPENYENTLRDLQTRRIYLGQMIKSFESKDQRAKAWIQENRKEIITSYKELLNLIAEEKGDEIRKILVAEDKKIKNARPTPKANEIFLRIALEEDKIIDIKYSFEGTLPEQDKVEEFIASKDLGLSPYSFQKICNYIKMAVEQERGKAFDPEKLDQDIEDIFGKIKNSDAKIVVKLHDRKPLPKTSDDLHSIWGVVLDIQDENGKRASTKISETFPTHKKLQEILGSFALGVPQSLFNEIDDITRKNIEDEKSLALSDEVKSGWFKRITGKEDQQFEHAIAETKTEILDIENNPVFAKARNRDFGDWLEAMTMDRGDEPYPEPETHDALLEQHKKAENVIRLAQNDFNETLRSFSEAIVEDAHAYLALTQALENLKDDENVAILNKATDDKLFKDFKAWALENNEFDSLTEMAFKQLGHSQQMLDILDILEAQTEEKPLTLLYPKLSEDQAARKLVKDYISRALDIFDDVYSNIDKNAELLSRIIRKSGASYINAIIDTNIIEKIYTSPGNSDPKIKLISALLKAGFSDGRDTHKLVTSAFSLLNLSEKADQRLVEISDYSHDLFKDSYALAKLMNPKADILSPYLDNPQAMNSPEIFMLLWERGVTHLTLDKIDIAKKLISNAISSPKWSNVLPAFYQMDDEGFVKSVYTHLLSGQPKTVFDTIYETGNADTIKAALSILETPVERANFYAFAADATQDKNLEKEYRANVKALDGEFLEYKPGYILNPAEITNIFCTGSDGVINDIQVTTSDQSFSLPGFDGTHQARELYEALSRTDLMLVGDEYINPRKIHYLECVQSDEGDYITFSYNKNFVTKVYLNDNENLDDILQAISATNPDFMELNGDSLVNLKALDQIFFDDDNNAYFIAGELCFKALNLSEAEYKTLSKSLEQVDHLERLGSHIINIDAIDAIQFSDDGEDVRFEAGGTIYDGTNRIRHFQDAFARFVLPAVVLDKLQAINAGKTLITNGFVAATDANVLVNPTRLCFSSVETVQGQNAQRYTLFFQSNNAQYRSGKAPTEIYTAETSFEENLSASANLKALGQYLIAVDKITNVSANADDTYISLGDTSLNVKTRNLRDDGIRYKISNETKGLLSTGVESLRPEHIETAYVSGKEILKVNFVNQTECQVRASSAESTISALVKPKGAVSKMALETRNLDRKTAVQIRDWSGLDTLQRQLSEPGSQILLGKSMDIESEQLAQTFNAQAEAASNDDNPISHEMGITDRKHRGWPPRN